MTGIAISYSSPIYGGCAPLSLEGRMGRPAGPWLTYKEPQQAYGLLCSIEASQERRAPIPRFAGTSPINGGKEI